MNWDVTRVLELLDWQFKITMSNMLVALMETNVQKQMDNVSREMEILRSKGNARKKNPTAEVKNAFIGH